MILDHAVSLLQRGESLISQEQFTSAIQVYFKLQSGVSTKKVDSMKTALMMIEVIRACSRHSEHPEQLRRFDNFVSYVFETFNEPIAMALVKYAIAERKINIKKLADSSSWGRVAGSFKPVLLDCTNDSVERAKYARFERVHKRLKKMAELSDAMYDFVVSDLAEVAGRV